MRYLCVVMAAASIVLALCGAPLAAQESAASWDAAKGPGDAWVYVVFAAHDGASAQLTRLAQKLGLEAEVQDLPSQLRQGLQGAAGVGADAIDLNRPFALAVFNFLGGQPPVIFVPVKADVALPDHVQTANGYVAACDNDLLAARMASALKAAGSGAIAAPKGLVHIHVDLGTMFQLFGPLLQMQLAMGMGQMGDMTPAQQRTATAMVGTLFDIVGQVSHFDLDVALSDQDITLQSNVRMKSESALAGMFAAQKGGTALGALLPARSMALSARLAGLSAHLGDMAKTIMGKMQAGAKDQAVIMDAVGPFLAKVGDEFAMAYDLGQDGMVGEYVFAFQGGMQDMRAYFDFFSGKQMPQAFRDLLGGVEYEVSRAVRTSGGVEVDAFKGAFDLAGADPAVQAQVKALWGDAGLTGQYAIVKGLCVMAMGGKDCAERLDAQIAKVSAGAAGAPGEEPITFRFDLMTLVEGVMSSMGMGTGASSPPAPISGSVRFEGATAVKQLRIPVETVARLMAIGGMAGL